jgi:uncharacterized RDD family membrane protein YckC
MPCINHPEVISGLDSCTACGKTFCIDCIVGRKSGWFCAACDPDKKPQQVPAAAEAFTRSPFGGVVPAKPKPPSGVRACTNHPEVLTDLYACTRCDRTFCPDCLVLLKGSRFCAGCKTDAVKDMQSGLSATGTGLQLATIGPRLVAYIIDMIVIYAIFFLFMALIGMAAALAKPDPNSVFVPMMTCGMFVVFFAALFGYPGIMVQWKGQTLGKMAAKVKVVSADGSRVTAGQAWIRAVVCFFLQAFWITYIPAFFNDERMTIHDMAARTRVVRVD